jgi:cytoskeletal protein RodZ
MRSVGRLLTSAREGKKLTLQDVHKIIKIHPKYLKALEEDNYFIFEGKVHAKGFLKVYANFLGLDMDGVLALWRREYEPSFETPKSDKLFHLKPLEKPKIVLTPGLIISFLLVLLVIFFFGYLFYQYRTYTGNPKLEVFYPEDNKMVTSDLLDITGKTELDSEVFINNQKVILNPNGNFAVTIKLKEGINTLDILAVNKLNKKTEDIRTVIYRPIEKPKQIPESTESTVSIPKM